MLTARSDVAFARRGARGGSRRLPRQAVRARRAEGARPGAPAGVARTEPRSSSSNARGSASTSGGGERPAGSEELPLTRRELDLLVRLAEGARRRRPARGPPRGRLGARDPGGRGEPRGHREPAQEEAAPMARTGASCGTSGASATRSTRASRMIDSVAREADGRRDAPDGGRLLARPRRRVRASRCGSSGNGTTPLALDDHRGRRRADLRARDGRGGTRRRGVGPGGPRPGPRPVGPGRAAGRDDRSSPSSAGHRSEARTECCRPAGSRPGARWRVDSSSSSSAGPRTVSLFGGLFWVSLLVAALPSSLVALAVGRRAGRAAARPIEDLARRLGEVHHPRDYVPVPARGPAGGGGDPRSRLRRGPRASRRGPGEGGLLRPERRARAPDAPDADPAQGREGGGGRGGRAAVGARGRHRRGRSSRAPRGRPPRPRPRRDRPASTPVRR